MVNKKEELLAKIAPIIAEQLKIKPAEIKLSSRLIDDLSADSLDAVEIVMGIEEKFNVEIPDEEIDKIKTIEDIVDYLARKIGEG
jgi:acyl carrier protein